MLLRLESLPGARELGMVYGKAHERVLNIGRPGLIAPTMDSRHRAELRQVGCHTLWHSTVDLSCVCRVACMKRVLPSWDQNLSLGLL